MNKYKIGFWICLLPIFVFSVFAVAGIYNIFWNIPDKIEQIEKLTLRADAWESRAKELDAYIIEKEKQFRVANRWSHFFEMMCSENNEVKFDFLKTKLDGLDEYVKDGKKRFKAHK